MLIAALTSRSSSVPQSQECQRSDKSFLRTCPHPEQTCEVNLGSTLFSVRPAHAALTEHRLTKAPNLRLKCFCLSHPSRPLHQEDSSHFRLVWASASW